MTQANDTIQGHPTRIIARANPHDLSFWRKHPDVVDVQSKETDEPDSILVGLLLKEPGDYDPPPRAPKAGLDRAPDIEIGFDGDAHPTFWERLPDVERIDLHEEPVGDPEEAPYGWWHARIWLKH